MFARNYGREDPWVTAVFLKQTGPTSYVVRVGNTQWRRHLDQLRLTKLLMLPETQGSLSRQAEAESIIPSEQPATRSTATEPEPQVEAESHPDMLSASTNYSR